ncbi:NAD(P)-binding protein [Meredithblackwellia eburnea MCA 4105]
MNPGRCAIVGLGSRGLMFVRGVAARPGATIVAVCDLNKVRAKFYQDTLKELGEPEPAYYSTDNFRLMLEREKVQTVIVTTVDAYHDVYILQALDAGVRVLTEKPMTTDVEKCKKINEACHRLDKHISVTFNYRFNPCHELVKRTILDGKIGKVISVHFEWLLDTVHGADYFKRWHADKSNSGGLMIHKSGHHFDLVNWWLDAVPTHVAGFGQLGFYGDKAGKASGFAKDYSRARGSEIAKSDPFATHLESSDTLKKLYADAEGEDGYFRDKNCFQPGITIEDDVSLIVKYNTGATMSYHLTAYSPWEGYRVMFNGTEGRLELSVVESTHRIPGTAMGAGGTAIHGSAAAPHPGPVSVKLQRLWEEAIELPVVIDHANHGGGDKRMLNVLFGPVPGEVEDMGFAAKQGATEIDGTRALAVGLAANESFATGRMITISELGI